jgi:thioesterase domain-containing protein
MRSLVPLIDAYRPRERFAGSILLFHTDTDMAFWGLPREEHRGWARDVSGEIREVHVSCQHVELPSEPFIGEVAVTLRTFLRTSPPER